jgi:hypothetical protein
VLQVLSEPWVDEAYKTFASDRDKTLSDLTEINIVEMSIRLKFSWIASACYHIAQLSCEELPATV